jgi:hypothetical protein
LISSQLLYFIDTCQQVRIDGHFENSLASLPQPRIYSIPIVRHMANLLNASGKHTRFTGSELPQHHNLLEFVHVEFVEISP